LTSSSLLLILFEVTNKFKQQWIDRPAFRGWYDAFVPLISTNNALERRNLDIKENYTFRERVSVPSFFNKVETMLNEWSLDILEKPVYISFRYLFMQLHIFSLPLSRRQPWMSTRLHGNIRSEIQRQV
jgi:hypothetical protein